MTPPNGAAPRVSVIIIFLNAEKFLAQAVESVLAQSFTDWELLLVDDGSNDASTECAKGYATLHHSRIQYFEHAGHANRGMSASRNLGISSARGEYLAFLDADDVWLSHKLERQIEVLGRNAAAAMVYGAPLYWYSWTGEATDLDRDEIPQLVVPTATLLEPPSLFLTFLSGRAPPPWPSDVMIRRDVAIAVGGFEDAFRGMYEDQAFFSKVLLRYPVLATSECSMKYRQHPDSCYTISKRTGTRHAARGFYLRWLRRHLASANVRNREIWEAWKAEYQPYRVAHRVLSGWRRISQRLASILQGLRRATRGVAASRPSQS